MKSSTIIINILVVGFIVAYLMPTNSSFDADHPKAPTSTCNGPGNAGCDAEVRNYFNSKNGVEVNYSQYVGDGRFAVNVLVLSGTVAGEFSKVVTTDCNCKVVSVY